MTDGARGERSDFNRRRSAVRPRPGAWPLALLALGCLRPGSAALTTPVMAHAALPPDIDLPAPMDPAVRTGRLPNGLTYYVLAHGAPEKRAALWLAVEVGSVFEADAERGYAHFVEHLAFDGTRRFPKHEIFSFLERAGMTAGADVNAFTGTDETVYQLTVPTDDPATTAAGLDMLRDVAGDVSFDPAEIEHEKGIVLEEWRLHQSAAQRANERERALALAGSRYPERLPIGTPESIRAATPDALVAFYRRWYRPRAMAVIAVGDFEPAAVEAEIRARFAGLANPTPAAAPPARAFVPDRDLRIDVASDPEARLSTAVVYEPEARPLEITKRDYRARLVERLYSAMDQSRLGELRDNQGSPLVTSSATLLGLTRTTVARVRRVSAKEGRLGEALALVFGEIAQAGRYGFLQSELDRARADLVARIERATSEYDQSSLKARAAELLRHFTEWEEIAGPAVELGWIHELLPTITLDDVNELARAHAATADRAIAVVAAAGVKPPSAGEVRAIAGGAFQGPLFPWVDNVPDAALLASLPAPGRIVGAAHDAGADATVWTLSNGIRVVVKQTDFLKDSVSLSGWQAGGTSLASDADFPSARFAGEIVGLSGAGPFNQRQLNKLLGGRRLSVSIGIGELGARVTADATVENLETMLQLLYLRFVGARRDARTFEYWQGRWRETVRHRADSPEQQFNDQVVALANGDHPRRRPITGQAIEAVDGGKAYEFWKRELADLGGFTFVIVGNVDPARLRPLVETYLGSLPGTPGPHRWRDIGVAYPASRLEKTVVAGRAPKSLVWVDFSGPARFTLDAERDARVLETLLRIRLRERLREEMGAVYNAAVAVRALREPTERQSLSISFPCAPANVERLRAATFDVLAELAARGPDARLLAVVAEQLRRQHALERRDNRWWLRRLLQSAVYGDDFGQANDLAALEARVTAADVQATVRRLYDDQRYLEAVLRPAGPPATGGAEPEPTEPALPAGPTPAGEPLAP